jgi:hypothetical protein
VDVLRRNNLCHLEVGGNPPAPDLDQVRIELKIGSAYPGAAGGYCCKKKNYDMKYSAACSRLLDLIRVGLPFSVPVPKNFSLIKK